MMMPEITMGMTKTVRSAVLNLTRVVRPTASRNAATLTTITVASEKPNVNR